MRRVLSTPKHAHGLCAQMHVNVWHFRFRSASVFNEKCVITGEPARYRDPITGQPYSTLAAFKILRERFAQQVGGIETQHAELSERIV